MKKLIEYTYLEFKLLFRVPIGLFFTLLFPEMLMISFVIMSKNNVIYQDIHFIDVYLPVMMLLSLFSAGIISFSVIVAGNRNQKLWQVYRLRGFKIWQIISAQLFVNIILSFISSILLIITAYVAFDAKISSVTVLWKFLAVWMIVAIAVFLIGFLIGVFMKTEKVAQAVSTPIMFIFMIFSGIMVEFSALPEKIQNVMIYLPTTQANWILVKYWTNMDTMNKKIHWEVLIVWCIVSLAIIVWKLYKDDFKKI